MLAQMHIAGAANDIAPVLRGRSLEIIDTAERKFSRPVTAHEVVGGDLFLRRCLFPADVSRVPAARMEMAARRCIGGIGDLAL